MKFKVGDRVVANEKADALYNITRNGWQGVVVKVCGEDLMVVAVDPRNSRGRRNDFVWARPGTKFD